MSYLYLMCAYLIGSISFSYIFVKVFKGKDIRKEGSKNAGSTNVMRSHGFLLGILSLVFDFLKGGIVVYLFKKYDLGIPALGLLFAMIGHCYPFYLSFKGGKGVATYAGGMTFLYPILFPIGLVIYGSVLAITKYASVASLSMVLSVGLIFILFSHPTKVEILIIILAIVFVYLKHNQNIKRLFEGRENKFKLGGRG